MYFFLFLYRNDCFVLNGRGGAKVGSEKGEIKEEREIISEL